MVGDEIRYIIPWSRLLDDQEILLAINTDPDQPHTAWCRVDSNLHQAGNRLHCIYSSDPLQVGQGLTVEKIGDRMVVRLTTPAAGFVIFE